VNAAELRDTGMGQSARKNATVLSLARRIAIACGHEKEIISIDDVREKAVSLGYEIDFSGNWVGSVFRGPWKHMGYDESRHKDGHGRTIKRWSLIKSALAKNPATQVLKKSKLCSTQGVQLSFLSLDQHGNEVPRTHDKSVKSEMVK